MAEQKEKKRRNRKTKKGLFGTRIKQRITKQVGKHIDWKDALSSMLPIETEIMIEDAVFLDKPTRVKLIVDKILYQGYEYYSLMIREQS